MKYEVYESYHLVPFEGYVDKVSNNNISLRTWYSSPIDQARVAVFNIRERVWWEAPNISNPLTSQDAFDDFHLELTDNFVAIKIPMHIAIGDRTAYLLRVWSLQTKEVMFEDVIPNLIFMTVDKYEHPHLLVLYGNFMQVLNFKDTQNVTSSRVHATVNPFSYGSFHNPFIMQIVNHVIGIESFKIWKYDEEAGIIDLYKDVPDVKRFLKYSVPNGFINSIEKVVYIKDSFLITSKVTVADASFHGFYFFYSMAIQMIDENGNILKQYFIPQYQIDPYIDFHFYNKKLFIEIDERLYVYQNVFASSYDNVEGDGTDDMKINPIRDLVGRSTLMLTNVELERQNLKRKRINIWVLDWQNV